MSAKPSAFFISAPQYFLSNPNTLCKLPVPFLRNISALTFPFDTTIAWDMNLLLSAFGNSLLKGAHASFSASAICFFPSAVFIHCKRELYFEESILKLQNIFSIKMVVLTIVTNTNGETLNFQEAIPKVDFMKVVSCSLYNSWHNLKST